jgi:hypothetical protein
MVGNYEVMKDMNGMVGCEKWEVRVLGLEGARYFGRGGRGKTLMVQTGNFVGHKYSTRERE